jgi:hypothetical protein
MSIDKLKVKAKVVYKALNGFDYTIKDCYDHQRLIFIETEKLTYSKGQVYSEISEPLVGKS